MAGGISSVRILGVRVDALTYASERRFAQRALQALANEEAGTEG